MPQSILEIDLTALEHNVDYLRSKLTPGVKLMAVVKAYAYGSEPAAVAQKLMSLGVDYFAVAFVEEGVTLRDAGITAPILVLHPQPSGFDTIIERCLEPNLYSFRVLQGFIASAKAKQQQNYPVHLKFNTGLNRLGFKKGDEPKILETLAATDAIMVRSLFSHLVASEDLSERDFTLKQISDFKEIASHMLEKLDYKPFLHQSNTSAILNFPEAQFDMVRAGIGLYGYGNNPEEDKNLIPVASLKSVISQIHTIEKGESVGYNRGFFAERQMRTATIPLGHADGLSRAYGKGKGYVYINGKKAEIVGNVCMDMIMVNVTEIDCQEGDEVEVFGKLSSASRLSATIGSIPYELLTAISQRVLRIIRE
ncbi:MAG: alanine racemase [Cytophagaceae bacterium]|nr:alanine racemase [Cytophagaceae bacterium]|tara:strand:+ start:3645 stop:4742 length:1098 start_codon:yes stop_codon:yes gene_type:complete